MIKDLESISKRIDQLKNATYNSSVELYKIRDREYVTRQAYKMELSELELKKERMIARTKWLNGGM